MDALSALSPVDGRYATKVDRLRDDLSEMGLIKHRLAVEVAWFIALSQHEAIHELPTLTDEQRASLNALVSEFSIEDAQAVKDIEKTTNHDVKAVEYFLKNKMKALGFSNAHCEFIHFACTSEDINNLAYARMLKVARDEVIVPHLKTLLQLGKKMSKEYASQPMLSRTHGQPASPTTMGKEFANVFARVEKAIADIEACTFPGKLNGAVGNYNAHLSAYPDAPWPAIAKNLIEDMGLEYNPYTIQIEPHDGMARFSDAMRRLNVVWIDFARDVWGYISLGYFKQKVIAGEVGSSTMPHKVNPIDFENAEGNLGLANAVLDHLSNKLPVSRYQRDLTDSTVLRNWGMALGHMLIAQKSLEKGFGKLELNAARVDADIDAAWEVLAEPVQTVMRRYGIENPYEQLKALTRGQAINQEILQQFISDLDIPSDAKTRLLALTPRAYIGNAVAAALQLAEG